MGPAATIVSAPTYLPKAITATIGITITLVTTTSRILPLSLGRKTEVLTCELIQLRNESLAIVPTHIFYRELQALIIAWIATHHGFPKFLSHLGLTNGEVCQFNFMNRLLKIIPASSHLESASLN